LVLIENRGEAGEDDSIRCIVNNFSKVIDEMNPPTTNSHGEFLTMNPTREVVHEVEGNFWSDYPKIGTTSMFGHDYTNTSFNMHLDGDGVRVSSLVGRPRPVVASAENQNVSQPDGRTTEHVETFNAPKSLTGNYSSPADVVISQALDAPIIQPASIRMESSYASVTSSQQPKPSQGEPTNFMYRQVDNVFEGVDISMPRRVVENVSTRFENTLYGYFIGKRLAFPVVEYYVKNNWAKFGLKRIMLNAKGFFFFKFDSRVGLENVLECGPWMFRNNPIILKRWTMNTSLLKEELSRILIWVKLHDVPLEVFDEEGISILGSHLEKPIMLDAYTSSMCKDSWGRSSFARCLIEVNADKQLKDSFSIGIPVLDGHPDGPLFTKEVIRVEYEWMPLRCDKCKIFGHCGDTCPRNVQAAKKVDDVDDGKKFAYVPKSNGTSTKGKSSTDIPTTSSKGLNDNSKPLNAATKPSTSTNEPRPEPSDIGISHPKKVQSSSLITQIPTSNPYDALSSYDNDEGGDINDDEEDVENIYDESANLISSSQTGAITPDDNSHVNVSIVYDTCRKVCRRWKWNSNGSLCSKGSRIILGWNDDNVDIMILSQTNQVMHCHVDRRVLWSNLAGHASFMHNKLWVLLSDFNATLNLEDHSCGGYEPNIAMREFKECVQRMEVMDVNATGLHFTWNQKPKEDNGTLKKIDRIMSNLSFFGEFPSSFAIFQPYRIYNHSPCVLRIPK
ncbi:uncharacterized protein Tco_1358940, partial [Tanacetum coccineum]